MIIKLQELKGKTKLKFFTKRNNYYAEKKNINYRSQEDPFSKNAQGISKIYHEVLLLLKFLQTKLRIKNMNIKYDDLYYTVIQTRAENDIIDNEYEIDDKDYITFNDFITPNLYIGIKKKEILK